MEEKKFCFANSQFRNIYLTDSVTLWQKGQDTSCRIPFFLRLSFVGIIFLDSQVSHSGVERGTPNILPHLQMRNR